jgi:putative ABC transport system substrate-binding protein
VRRRDFIKAAAGSAAAWPLAARAQRNNKLPIIGVLWHAASADEEDVYLSVLRKAFNDLGYIEGKDVVFEHRFPAENSNRFQTLARELVDAKPDAIIAVTVLGAIALQKFTNTIPIVFVLVPDPLGLGLVKSLGRPGGNATGLSLMSMDLSGKRLALLKEAVPNLSRVALLLGVTDPLRERTIANHQAAAQALGISLWPAEISGPDNVEPAFAKIGEDRADGVVRGTGADLFILRARIGASAMAHRLPGITFIGEELPYGFLLSYGQDFPDFFRRAAAYVDKILKGTSPADLPVEQPTKFKLVINLKTVKTLGITASKTLLTAADEVIE